MATTKFLLNKALWHELRTRTQQAKMVSAAVAYLQVGALERMPLRKGHTLVVNLSEKTVRSGSTNPFEVERFLQRNVRVFTRRNLHAKTVVMDSAVLASSANITRNALKLDEAGILTNDSAAVLRARAFVDRIATEPVRPEFLNRLKPMYEPPRFGGGMRTKMATGPRLWIVALSDYEVPKAESDDYSRGENEAKRYARGPNSELDSFHWPHEPRMASIAQFGDWFIMITSLSRNQRQVSPPGQLLRITNHPKARGRGRRWVFHLELPAAGETMSYDDLRRRLDLPKSPRTRAIPDDKADAFLRLWTLQGRLSRKRTRAR